MTSIFKYDEPKRLTFTEGNPKTDKNLKLDEFKKYWILRLNLAPAKLSGFQVCPKASEGCAKACLHTAGNPIFMKQKSKGRINRTRFYFQNRIKFLTQLFKEIKNHEINCKKKDLLPVCRLNTTSDISWEVHKIFEQFPNVQFYDYTKIKKRALKFVNGEYPNNYHLTFSLNEDNYKDSMDILSKGGNVAMVFRKQLPETYKGYQVVNGDEHDLRFLDLRNSIVGLKAKGKAKTDYSGFVLDI
tara:strand:- start:637 stop:1365 length:729 start_codon:yes stop_codon:yes gene_type:complete